MLGNILGLLGPMVTTQVGDKSNAEDIREPNEFKKTVKEAITKYPELKDIKGTWDKKGYCHKGGCFLMIKLKVEGDTAFRGGILKVGTEIEFSAGQLSIIGILSGNQVIDGVKFKGGTEILFRNNGKVSLGILAEDQMVQDVKLKAGKVDFHDSGKLSSGTLAETQTIQGVKYQGGTSIHFYYTGKVYEGVLAEKLQYPNCLPGSMIYFSKPDEPKCESK